MEERYLLRTMERPELSDMVQGLHKPVLLEEALFFLNPAPGKVIVDATIGLAGHAKEIVQKISPGGTLIGIDRDSESLKIAHERLKSFQGMFKLINENFRNLKEILKSIGIEKVDGVLLDLGVSSLQLDRGDRGFSIKNNGPLDMRMDKDQVLTAKDLVNSLREDELSHLIRDFGEERFHRRIAGNIVNMRRKNQIKTTGELAEVIIASIPYSRRHGRIHPATRTFQALRIKVNDELCALEEVLKGLPHILKNGARACVVSFHSLEDRIVKNIFRELAKEGLFRILTKRIVTAGEKEIFENPRARSAKLRAIEAL